MKSYIETLEQRLADWHQRILQIEQSIDSVDGKTRDQYQQELKEIHQHRGEVEAKLTELKIAKAEEWEKEDFREGMIEIFDSIGARIDAALARIGH